MEVLNIIDELEDIIDDAAKVPFAGKCMVDKDALLDLIEELRLKLPEDLKQAKWVKDERQRILAEAQKEAESIVKSAEEKTISMINEHEITRQAADKAKEILEHEQNNAREMRMGTKRYVDSVLEDLENALTKMTEEVHANRQSLRK